ncbi:MAG: holo-ACP synthase [Spirochaetaceae bacterium]|nr:holo-ACP synthase [Spirochaetaceae bacterium]
MIFGTGIDLTSIDRFEKWIDNTSFCSKYYSDDEMAYIRSRGKGAIYSMAAGFAAKEAFGKAMGTGLFCMSLKAITVLRDDKGKPYFRFDDTIIEKMQSCGKNPRVHLSLSHESQWAIAQVIIEVDNG